MERSNGLKRTAGRHFHFQSNCLRLGVFWVLLSLRQQILGAANPQATDYFGFDIAMMYQDVS